MTEQATKNAVITGYRELIDRRYQYKEMAKEPDLPETFDRERTALFKNYALTYLYPTVERRKELDDAFLQLDNYVKNPVKLMKMVTMSSRLIFKYGRHLPRMLKAGLKALRSFRKANDFETQLTREAQRLKMPTPFKIKEIKTLISALSIEEMNEFIDSTESLFSILHDRKLVIRIIDVISYLLTQMNQQPDVFSASERAALQLGLDLIQKGNDLFDLLTEEEQQQIFTFVTARERRFLEGLGKNE